MRAVVTGGTKGIGRAVAERLATPDARILVNYLRDEPSAHRVVEALRARGAWARAVRGDACTVEGAHELADAAARDLETVDALVHCAVWTTTGAALEIDPATYREAVDRNGSSLLWLAQAFRGWLVRGSSIVFITSQASLHAVPGNVAVGTAKALAEALVRYLAAELASDGIRVNSVSAGPVDTESFRALVPDADRLLAAVERRSPSRRRLLAADVANAVALLLSGDAGMIQGERLNVDGGLRLG